MRPTSSEVTTRLGHLPADDSHAEPEPLSGDSHVRSMHIAIAIVAHDEHILLRCRRGDDAGGIKRQSPTGIVKPRTSPETTAIHEVLAETDVRCAVREQLGTRVHPITSVYCEYLGGTARNVDPVENVDVAWAPREDVTRHILPESIFAPVLAILDGEHDRTNS